MALVNLNFESQYLKGNTQVSIILPDRPREMDAGKFYGCGKKYKVVWLLHGGAGDHTDYIRKSLIELYASERNIMAVMPSAHNSEYLNWKSYTGSKYYMHDYFFEELMPLVYNWFPASDKREDNFIAGFSMGGGGALKFLLSHPERFAAACLMSNPPINLNDDGVVPANSRFGLNVERNAAAIHNAGSLEAFKKSIDNTWQRLDDLMPTGVLPKLFFITGEKDFGFADWDRFRRHAEDLMWPCKFETIPGYGHEWRLWNTALEKALDFFEMGIEDARVDAGGLKEAE